MRLPPVNAAHADFRDRASLDAESADLLLQRLLSWLVRLVSNDEGPLVLKKLCSALIAYYLKPSGSWHRCVRHLICCFSAGDAIAYDVLDQYPTTNELIARMSRSQLITTIWLITTIVEEVGRMDSNSVQTYVRHAPRSSQATPTDKVPVLQAQISRKSST